MAHDPRREPEEELTPPKPTPRITLEMLNARHDARALKELCLAKARSIATAESERAGALGDFAGLCAYYSARFEAWSHEDVSFPQKNRELRAYHALSTAARTELNELPT
jgi:hypothetical protein